MRKFLAFAAAAIAAAALSGCGYNNIPRLDEQVKASWSEVLNQYKRRADLVPNLVETVKGFAAQEKSVLTEVTQARASASQMKIPDDILTNPQAFQQFQANQAQLTGALGRLLVTNQNFLALQSQLEGTENRIAVARRDYIQAVQAYNTELRTIPGRWYASLFYPDAKVKETFTVTAAEQETPKVKF